LLRAECTFVDFGSAVGPLGFQGNQATGAFERSRFSAGASTQPVIVLDREASARLSQCLFEVPAGRSVPLLQVGQGSAVFSDGQHSLAGVGSPSEQALPLDAAPDIFLSAEDPWVVAARVRHACVLSHESLLPPHACVPSHESRRTHACS
jgi:hypothetical protein